MGTKIFFFNSLNKSNYFAVGWLRKSIDILIFIRIYLKVIIFVIDFG